VADTTPSGKGEAFPRPFGKYTLQREAGRGGKGVVYEATDTVLQRRVALKVSLKNRKVTPEEAKAEEERFLVEARIGALLPKHPHIVGVYEAGVIDEQRYLSTEFIEGEPMTRWKKNPNVTMGQQVRLLRDVSLAVEHAHAHGVIHRDLKPSNILVDKGAQPHLTDFGLAKMTGQKEDTARTRGGKIWGTPAYVSPEHARGLDVDHRSDIYSLGVMLYEILTGRTPFQGPTSSDVLAKATRELVVPPSRVLKPGTLSGRQLDLEPVCMKALSKDPAQRHPSAKAFAESLTRWLDYGKTVRAQEKKSRMPLIAGAAAVVFVGLILAIVMATRKSGPTPEELKAREQEQARLKEQMEEEKNRATREAASRARIEAEEKAKKEREGLQKEMDAKRRAAEEESLREQARLDAQRREAEERARKAEEQLKQPRPGDPATPATPETPVAPPPKTPVTETPKPPVPGTSGTKAAPVEPPTGDPKTLETGALHWEAEDFTGADKPVEGQDYHDATPGNVGKAYRESDVDIFAPADGTVVFVAGVTPGEWLRYRFKGGGRYEVEVRYLSRRGGTLHVEVDGVNVTGPVALAGSLDRVNWATVTTPPSQNIPEGDHSLRVVFDSILHGFDYFRLKRVVLLPPPEAAQLRETEKIIRDLFKAEYARRAPVDQLALARKLLQEGLKADSDPLTRYVLLSEARDVAAQAGDAATIFQAVDEIDRRYLIDAPAMKLAAMNAASRTVRTPEAAKALADAFSTFAETAAGQDDYDQALALLGKAEAAARMAQNPALVVKVQSRVKEMTALRDEFKPLKSALKTLETKPDDPAANLALGLYRCFVRDDWPQGLPMLAKGSDPALAALARKEIEGADAAEQEVALADGWREAGDKKTGQLKTRCLTRALYWYEKAAGEVTGLERLKVDSQIEALYKVLGGDTLKKGLAFWVEPARDQGEGHRELAFLARSTSNSTKVLMDGTVRALNISVGFAEYGAVDAVRLIEKQGSVFAWVKCEKIVDLAGTVISRGDVGLEAEDFSFGMYEGRVYSRFNGVSAAAVYSKGAIAPAKWTLMGVTWDGTGLSFYIDGKKDSEVTLAAPLAPPKRYLKVHVGKSVLSDHRFFPGILGALLVYNRELSPAEVTQLCIGSRSKFR
jgi:tRNA A-37 threonylcarbamoyl transferase component Bud32